MSQKRTRRALQTPVDPRLPRFRVLVYDLDESETQPTFDVIVNAYIAATGGYDSTINEWDCKIRRAGSLGMLVHLADAVPEAIKAAIDQLADRPETR